MHCLDGLVGPCDTSADQIAVVIFHKEPITAPKIGKASSRAKVYSTRVAVTAQPYQYEQLLG